MIPIKNIYYMLSYAFHILTKQGYNKFAAESFDNTAELCAAILACGVTYQIKRGLGKEYIPQTETLSTLRGKIDFSESNKALTFHRRQMVCSYDEFSVNSYMNQIIKSTMLFLIHADIDKDRKKELRKLLVFFDEVDVIDVHSINWNLQYNRNNQTYRMLIFICYLVIKGLIQTQALSSVKLMDFLNDKPMCWLYEKFILKYFRKEHPQISASASQISWQLDDGVSSMLPVMQTDIMLTYEEKTLIIDAKYYSSTTRTKFNKATLYSNNLYQIFTYVKNKEAELRNCPHEVSGMLLYAKTDEEVYPENEYRMSGNRIEVRTLDLDCDFSMIRSQLDGIVKKYFGIGLT